MKIGIVGLGDLGMPLALAINLKGHEVIGTDLRKERMQKDWFHAIEKGPEGEPTIEGLLRKSTVDFEENLTRLIKFTDIIFVVVQTPNYVEYDGTVPLPHNRENYNLEPLRHALKDIIHIIKKNGFKKKIINIVSTILTGTLYQFGEVEKIFDQKDEDIILIHNPMFCAMGTVIPDFYDPEFVLLGYNRAKNDEHISKMIDFYGTITGSPIFTTTIDNACMIKTCYNAFITMKINFANMVMEMSDRLGTDCDTIMDCLTMATRRLISPAYLKGGMGDGGGCHPKENLALSWLAKYTDLSYDFFEANMICREKQTEYLADLVGHALKKLPGAIVWLMGKAFKANTNLTDGSPALLLHNILSRRGVSVKIFDPLCGDKKETLPIGPSIFVLTTNHTVFKDYTYPAGSVVIDPWRVVDDHPNVFVHRVGRGIA